MGMTYIFFGIIIIIKIDVQEKVCKGAFHSIWSMEVEI